MRPPHVGFGARELLLDLCPFVVEPVAIRFPVREGIGSEFLQDFKFEMVECRDVKALSNE